MKTITTLRHLNSTETTLSADYMRIIADLFKECQKFMISLQREVSFSWVCFLKSPTDAISDFATLKMGEETYSNRSPNSGFHE